MNLSAHSKNKLYHSFSAYEIPREWVYVMYNYLVHGLHPGSFFTALLANDAMGAIVHSHPSNTIVVLKSLVSWIKNELPHNVGNGSYEIVHEWTRLSAGQRRSVLEASDLIYSERYEIVLILKDEPTKEPFFW